MVKLRGQHEQVVAVVRALVAQANTQSVLTTTVQSPPAPVNSPAPVKTAACERRFLPGYIFTPSSLCCRG